MELKLVRQTRTANSTTGELFINGKSECFIIEDKDRGLTSQMTEAEIQAKKVHAKTAIPSGRYQVILSFSNRFQKYLPEVLGVKGYAGIRIHPGNTAADSEGCLLPGKTKSVDAVGDSRTAFTALYKQLAAVEKKEKIYITIQ